MNLRTITSPVTIAIAISITSAVGAVKQAECEWIRTGADGKLVYKKIDSGDRIMDFSHAGYRGGGVPLPTVPVKRTVQPSGTNDNTTSIQRALDEVAALPLVDGFRGAVLLSPGEFRCDGTLNITSSGVVLRGSGSGHQTGPRTIIRMTGKPHLGIAVRKPRNTRESTTPTVAQGNTTSVSDAYVPSGSVYFTVLDASGFQAGDLIEIRRPVTPAWIEFMGMHDLLRDGKPQTWLRAGSFTRVERRIRGIAGKTITLDVPLPDSFDSKYLNPPGTLVLKLAPAPGISQAGIEHLQIESPAQPISHSQPHFTAVRMDGEDCWMRDVICNETMNSVGISGQRITLTGVTVNRKARHEGSSRPAEFAPNAGQALLDRCAVNADNIWFVATGAGVAGPIVLLNCTFSGESRAESHQRWSTGMLYDNCRAPSGGMEFRNRGSMGSGHGWSMGWGVLWNCVAKEYVIQNPPGALNWMIGCMGENTLKPRPFGKGPMLPAGTMDAMGTPVAPQSLYLAQLRERLGSQALKNIGY